MTERTLKRQFITGADGTPVGVILPMDEFDLVKDILEQQFPGEAQPTPESQASSPNRSIKDEEFFGMWADRKDMVGRSSRDWLEDLRAQHWPYR